MRELECGDDAIFTGKICNLTIIIFPFNNIVPTAGFVKTIVILHLKVIRCPALVFQTIGGKYVYVFIEIYH